MPWVANRRPLRQHQRAGGADPAQVREVRAAQGLVPGPPPNTALLVTWLVLAATFAAKYSTIWSALVRPS
jgi:hypothetical protein